MLIKFRGGNMGMASRPVLVDLSSDIPESVKSSKLFKTAVDKQKLQDQIKKRELNISELHKSS